MSNHGHDYDPSSAVPGISVPLSYRREWSDGFGAQGWKLDAAIGHPEVIAATCYPGLKSLTSVPVHDVLDHWLPGFGYDPWGEAKATLQHALRNNLDIDGSYALLARDILGQETLVEATSAEAFSRLMDALYTEGTAAMPTALAAWRAHGLEYMHRKAIGLCLQHLLEQAEQHLAASGQELAHGHFLLGNETCRLDIEPMARFDAISLAARVDPKIAMFRR